ncbi:MAG: hypothetical protein PVH61_20650 [Candidatus Aminicenantes bacterium]
MTRLKFYKSKNLLFGLILFFSLTCFFSYSLNASEAKKAKWESENDLKTYERKSLFIFPVLYNAEINTRTLNDRRKLFLSTLMYQMFVNDFRRINFFDVRANESIDTFLQDAHSYIRRNVKQITAHRLQPDGKFKEAVVTSEDLLRTTDNSFALVPFFDSIEREVVEGEESTSYSYNIYVHFDIYSTKTKEKINTLKINNKKNVIGILSSVTGSLMLDHSDLNGLPEDEKKDEKSFRNAIAGLCTILKTKMKSMPEFRIMAELSMVNHSMFGFDMGQDTGIKIDHRYKTYVSLADGRQKMTGFGKIREVKESYSEAQILIGRPGEGDQVMEDPKVGINVVGGLGTAPLHINLGDDIVVGSHKCIFLGTEYELGPMMGMSEWYTALNLRIGLPSPENPYNDYFTVSQILLNLGVVKKIYLRRVALNFGGYLGVHAAALTDNSDNKLQGGGLGFTMNAVVEFMITPSISAFGGFNLDVYPNPSTLKDNGYEEPFLEGWDWNAKGLSLNLGMKVTF